MKASDEEKARFRALVPALPDVIVKPMFGQLGAFVNGKMFAGMYGETIGVKLAPADLAELSAVEGVGPFLPVKPMKQWCALPASYTDEEITAWIVRAAESSP
jgi:TfoX/Sxy family transcriptional regulator of competence genes